MYSAKIAAGSTAASRVASIVYPTGRLLEHWWASPMMDE
jgi:hypothetical protein